MMLIRPNVGTKCLSVIASAGGCNTVSTIYLLTVSCPRVSAITPRPRPCPVPGQLHQDHLNTKYSPLLWYLVLLRALHQAKLNSNAIRTPKCIYLINDAAVPSMNHQVNNIEMVCWSHLLTLVPLQSHGLLQHVDYLCYITGCLM